MRKVSMFLLLGCLLVFAGLSLNCAQDKTDEETGTATITLTGTGTTLTGTGTTLTGTGTGTKTGTGTTLTGTGTTLTGTGTGTKTGTGTTLTGTGTTGTGTGTTGTSTGTTQTVNLTPQQSQYWSGYVTTTGKTDGDLKICYGSTYGQTVAWAKFSLTEIPAGATILGATVSINVSSVTDAATSVYVKQVPSDPVTANYSTIYNLYASGTQLATASGISATGLKTWTLNTTGISVIQTAVNGSTGWVAIAFNAY